MAKTRDDAYALLDEIASNSYQWGSDRITIKKAWVYEVDILTAIQAQVAALSKKLDTHTVNAVAISSLYNVCGGPHNNGECSNWQAQQEQVNFVGNNNF